MVRLPKMPEKAGSNATPRPSSFEEVSTLQTQGSSFEERHQHLTSYRDSPPIRKSKQMLGVLHPASRSFLNSTKRKGLYRNHVKSLLSMRKPLLGDVSKPGQLSLALLDAILIFVLKARFWPSPCQKYDPRVALTGLTEVTSPETWATAT